MRVQTSMGVRAPILCLVLLGSALTSGAASAKDKTFSVLDSIVMSVFTDPDAYFGNAPDVAVPLSPDGAHFAVVTTRGLVESNETESSVWVFDTAPVNEVLHGKRTQPIRPALLARRTLVSNEGALISDVRWSADSRALFF